MKVIVSVGRCQYSEEIDPTTEYSEYITTEGEHYFRPLEKFPLSVFVQYNGNHFVYGWIENFMQRDDVPLFSESLENELFFEVSNDSFTREELKNIIKRCEKIQKDDSYPIAIRVATVELEVGARSMDVLLLEQELL